MSFTSPRLRCFHLVSCLLYFLLFLFHCFPSYLSSIIFSFTCFHPFTRNLSTSFTFNLSFPLLFYLFSPLCFIFHLSSVSPYLSGLSIISPLFIHQDTSIVSHICPPLYLFCSFLFSLGLAYLSCLFVFRVFILFSFSLHGAMIFYFEYV